MIIKGWSIRPARFSPTDIVIRMGNNRQRGFLTHHIEYAPTRREAIAQAIAWIERRMRDRKESKCLKTNVSDVVFR